ncbi:MAG: transcriptional regulator [Deltaproteobacteria bacterium]|nr:transcriptional regulator [Deltaproteobacteria bacterium]
MPPRKKLSHAARVLRIYETLQSAPFVTPRDLMERFGVSRRTIYNDFETLEEADIPIYSEPGPDGEARWQLQFAARRNVITLGRGQIVPFGLAKLSLGFLAGTDLYQQLETIISRLQQGAPPEARKHLRELPKKIAVVPFGPKRYLKQADVLNELLSALLYDSKLRIRYRRPGKRAKEHVIAPLTLLLYREALYFIAAFDDEEGHLDRPLLFAVDRVLEASWLRKERFAYPEDYDPHSIIDGGFGLMGGGAEEEVEVLFDAEQAEYIRERHWHDSQKLRKSSDGRLRVNLKVNGLWGVYRWLMGHADTSEVVGPPALRAQVREALKKALARHGG